MAECLRELSNPSRMAAIGRRLHGEIERRFELRAEALDRCRERRFVGVGEQQRELIAAEASHEVTFADNPECQQSASTTRTYGLTRGHTSLQRTLRNPR